MLNDFYFEVQFGLAKPNQRLENRKQFNTYADHIVVMVETEYELKNMTCI